MRPVASRIATRVPPVAKSLVAVVIAHNLVFLAGYGSDYWDPKDRMYSLGVQADSSR
jgi:hypothetical protein